MKRIVYLAIAAIGSIASAVAAPSYSGVLSEKASALAPSVVVVPEPATIGLMAAGLGAVILGAYRRNKK